MALKNIFLEREAGGYQIIQQKAYVNSRRRFVRRYLSAFFKWDSTVFSEIRMWWAISFCDMPCSRLSVNAIRHFSGSAFTNTVSLCSKAEKSRYSWVELSVLAGSKVVLYLSSFCCLTILLITSYLTAAAR